MKLFRSIYYGVLGVLVVALIALSCVDIAGTETKSAFDTDAALAHITAMTDVNSGSIYDEDAHKARVTYLTEKLTEIGLREVRTTETSAGRYTTTAVTENSFTAAEMVLTGKERYDWESIYKGEKPETAYTDTVLTDIVTYLPANGDAPTDDVMMFMAHYDSVRMGPGANDDLTSVSALLETIREVVDGGVKHNNALLFVFTDGEEAGMLGAQALKLKFDGFSKAYERVGFGANFESRGSDGSVVMFQSSANNYNLIKNWSRIRTTEFASSVSGFAYGMMPNYTDFAIFGEGIPALNFANIGGGESYHTQNDKIPNRTVVNNHGAMTLGLIDAFGSTDLASLRSETNSVYFSYLDWGTVAYSDASAYVIGALIVLVMIAAFVVGTLKKTLNGKEIAKGFGLQLLVLIGSVLFALAAYYLVGLILAACGVVSVHALPSILYSSIPLLFFAGLLVVGFSLVLYHLCRKFFKVNAGNMARGNIVLWALLGAILSFAAPALSYLFAWMGLAEAVVLLVTAIFKNLYREKTGESIDKLFLQALPMIFLLPMFFGIYLLLGDSLGACVYYATTAFAVLYCGFVTPYFSTLTPSLDRAVKHLPAPRVRVVRTVTEDVEDPVKKGKFTKKTYRKTTREAIPLSYRTWYGALAIMFVSIAVVFCLSGKGDFSANISGKANQDRMYLDDAIVYVYDSSVDAPYANYWMIGDLDAYSYFARATERFGWDAKLKAYVTEDTQNKSRAEEMLPSINSLTTTENSRTFTVNPRLDNMVYSLTFPSANRIRELQITTYLNDGSRSDTMTYTTGTESTYTVAGLLGQCEVKVVLRSDGEYTGNVTFDGKQIAYAHHEAIEDNSALREFEGVWQDVKTYYSDREEISEKLKAGIQIRGYSLNLA